MAATVVKLCRQRGVIIQDCDVYIGRACYQGGWQLPASKWANPYKVTTHGTLEEVLRLYELHVRNSTLIGQLEELRGKRLGCWCKCNTITYVSHVPGGHHCACGPHLCHGDVLVRLLLEHSAI